MVRAGQREPGTAPVAIVREVFEDDGPNAPIAAGKLALDRVRGPQPDSRREMAPLSGRCDSGKLSGQATPLKTDRKVLTDGLKGGSHPIGIVLRSAAGAIGESRSPLWVRSTVLATDIDLG